MKIKLHLSRTAWDGGLNAWVDVKTIEVEIPLEEQDGWHVTGAEWPETEEDA